MKKQKQAARRASAGSHSPKHRDWSLDTPRVLVVLNKILELELAGTVRYMHYSFMVFGHHRLPLIAWLRGQANESLLHAQIAGEHITGLGGHPSLEIGPLLETHRHEIEQILQESHGHESDALECYRELLELVKDKSVLLEEYARTQIASEETHLAELAKMMRVD
jgi:bacterioferritin